MEMLGRQLSSFWNAARGSFLIILVILIPRSSRGVLGTGGLEPNGLHINHVWMQSRSVSASSAKKSKNVWCRCLRLLQPLFRYVRTGDRFQLQTAGPFARDFTSVRHISFTDGVMKHVKAIAGHNWDLTPGRTPRYCSWEKDVREWDVSATVSNTQASIPPLRPLQLDWSWQERD